MLAISARLKHARLRSCVGVPLTLTPRLDPDLSSQPERDRLETDLGSAVNALPGESARTPHKYPTFKETQTGKTAGNH